MRQTSNLPRSLAPQPFPAFLILVPCLASLIFAGRANAGLVSDRSTLNSALAGFGPHTESFETISFATYPVGQVIPPVLNSTTPVYGFGSGLVVPGVTFRDPAMGALQWNGAGWYGQPSADLLSNDNTLEIDFASPSRGFGMSLLVYEGNGDNANVSIYGADNQTLLASYSGISISSPANPVFFGYQDPNGIGMVQITSTYWPWSPIIDDVTFATQVPEPTGPVLAALGLVLACLSKCLRLPKCSCANAGIW